MLDPLEVQIHPFKANEMKEFDAMVLSISVLLLVFVGYIFRVIYL